MMKSVKLTKRMCSDLEFLLRKAGAYHESSAFPSYVYVNKKTYADITKALTKEYKRQNSWAKKKTISFGVGMYLLNLGPNIISGSAIKDGYALVDTLSIEKEIDFIKTNSKGA